MLRRLLLIFLSVAGLSLVSLSGIFPQGMNQATIALAHHDDDRRDGTRCGQDPYVGYPYPADQRPWRINACNNIPIGLADQEMGLQETPFSVGDIVIAGPNGLIYRSDGVFLGNRCHILRIAVSGRVIDNSPEGQKGSGKNPNSWQMNADACPNSPTIVFPPATTPTPTTGCNDEGCLSPPPSANDGQRQPTGVGGSLRFGVGARVSGFMLSYDSGPTVSQCYESNTPKPGWVLDGALNPWPSEINKLPNCPR